MWFTWNDFDRHVASFNDLFRQLDRAARPSGGVDARAETGRFVLFETPESFDLKVDLPGVAKDELQLDIHDQTLTLSARRELKAPEGYAVLRSERPSFAWKRSVTLPGKIDPDRVDARFDNGVLCVRVAKAAEIQPRRITIATQA
jgi:HSP20 family protein